MLAIASLISIGLTWRFAYLFRVLIPEGGVKAQLSHCIQYALPPLYSSRSSLRAVRRNGSLKRRKLASRYGRKRES
jgi:hypothetical protein